MGSIIVVPRAVVGAVGASQKRVPVETSRAENGFHNDYRPLNSRFHVRLGEGNSSCKVARSLQN